MEQPEQAPKSSPLVMLGLVLSGALIGIAGSSYLLYQHRAFDAEVHLRLGEVASMKALQMSAWRQERVADAEVLATDVRLMPSVQRVLRGSATPAELEQAKGWLASILTHYRYENVVLTSPEGQVRLVVGAMLGGEGHFRQLTAEVLKSGGVRFNDFSLGNRGPHLGVNVALSTSTGEPLGALLLGIDPEHLLYPALRDWPGAGQTGELLMVRREGDSVLYLNETRLRPGTALTMSRPLSMTDLPAALAIQGRTEQVDGIDYRGEPVVASARPVPGANWFVVAKIDRSEAFEPRLRANIELGVLLLALLALAVALGRLILRRRTAWAYRDKYEAEMARKALLGRYDFLTRYANDAILVFETDGRIVEVNDRALEMFGYTREEMLRLSILDLKPGDLAVDFHTKMTVVDAEMGSVFETRNRRKDGASFPTEVSSSVVDLEGRHVYLSIIRDISERKAAEQQIRGLNHLYAVLSRCSGAIIRARSEQDLFAKVCQIIVESGGFRIGWVGKVEPETATVIPVASAGEEAAYLDEVRMMAGQGPLASGPTGTCIREGRAVAAADIATDALMAPWRDAAARHGLRSSVCLPLSRRGHTVYVLGMYSSEPNFFSAGEVALAEEVGESLSFALDRFDLESERKLAEEKRQLAQERLELALEAANEGYWDWDIPTGNVFVSPRFCAMLGYQHGELPLRLESLRDRTHPDDVAAVHQMYDALLRHGQSTSKAEFRVRHKDGHYIWVLETARVVTRDSLSQPLRIVGTRADITERKLLEQKFLQAQKMETVGRLAGGVAHDFNNHLTVINGYAELLRETLPQGSPLARPLEVIAGAGERAASLTRQLLAFSRKEIEQRVALDPNKIITGVQKMITRLMGENVVLKLELAPDLGFVMADATRLEQVVMNLATNARDAVQQRGTVVIKTELASAPRGVQAPDCSGSFVRLTVTDDGCGMTSEIQQHIFEPFYTTKDKSKGTGLGLATVYGIVQGMGGFIEVESEPGKGSSFHVYLPLTTANAASAEEKSSALPPMSGGETILVVEDEDDVRGVAVQILERYGYRVFAASGGAEALKLVDTSGGTIDCVVTDIMMPGMTGPEMIQILLLAHPNVKVMYLSGYAGDAIRVDRLMPAGALFLSKPYKADVLASKVRQLLSPAPTAAAR